MKPSRQRMAKTLPFQVNSRDSPLAFSSRFAAAPDSSSCLKSTPIPAGLCLEMRPKSTQYAP
jgi:hypothetical protein